MPIQPFASGNYRFLTHAFQYSGGVTAEYAYDPHGQRISKRVTDGHGLDVRTFFVGNSVEISGGNITPTSLPPWRLMSSWKAATVLRPIS